MSVINDWIFLHCSTPAGLKLKK